MKQSLFLTDETLWGQILAMDNLAIAKLLHDEGYPLAKDTVFTPEYGYDLLANTLFFKAIYQLFGVFCVIENGEEVFHYERVYKIAVKDSDVMTWHKLKKRARSYPQFRKEMDKSEERLVSGTRTSHLYYDMECSAELTPYGLLFTICEYYGTLWEFLKEIIIFKRALKGLIKKWESKLEGMESGKNPDRNMGKRAKTGRG
jgi:hypothetical protein